MIRQSIELQVISRILTSDDEEEIDRLCSYDESYYGTFKSIIHFILDHRDKYGTVPDILTVQSMFDEIGLEIETVTETLEYLEENIRKNKQWLLFVDTENKIIELGSGDIGEAWQYLYAQCDKALQLTEVNPMDLVHQSDIRAQQIIDFANQERIPTGFAEIDKMMYGGLSTVEELLLIVARTNTGKSWIATKMMETAQKNNFNVAYYSPEMQSAYLGTRFDTWRTHISNKEIYRGKYSDAYKNYITSLKGEEASAFVIEDKDMYDGVSARKLDPFIKKHKIKLLIIDGLSYMTDDKPSVRDVEKFKHICADLFNISKKYGCAVVVTVQANRETKESKDDKGDPFPTIYNIEGSDHPARIATTVLAVRQVFDKHVLDMRFEKSRYAELTKSVFSYSWDINNGNTQYLPGEDSTTTINTPVVTPSIMSDSTTPDMVTSTDIVDDEDVEF